MLLALMLSAAGGVRAQNEPSTGFEAFLAGAAWCGSGKSLAVRMTRGPGATWSAEKGAYVITVAGKPAPPKANKLSIDARTLSVCLPAGAPPLVVIQGLDSQGGPIDFTTTDLELAR